MLAPATETFQATAPRIDPSSPTLPLLVRQMRIDARGLRTLELAIGSGKVRVEAVDGARWVEARVTLLVADAEVEPFDARAALGVELLRVGDAARLIARLDDEETMALDVRLLVPRSISVILDHG